MSLMPLRKLACFAIVGAAVLGGIGARSAGSPASLRAEPLRPADVPAPLQVWIPWAMFGHEASLCPTLTGQESTICVWSGRLSLALDERGALPGDQEHWPLDVRDGAKRLAATSSATLPAHPPAKGE